MTETMQAGATSAPASGRLAPQQTDFLLTGITANRVQMLRGMAHLEAWDVRRQLIRIFGFEGFSIETVALDLVTEREAKQGDRSRWTVVYRAQVRLTIRNTEGHVVSHWEDAAAGDSVNQPSLGDAHDMAMKTALSQALKRCTVNLGDQFGLSLYNNGSHDRVVMRSLAYMGEPVPPQEDAPVQPEPTPEVLRAVQPEPVAEAEAPQRDFIREAQEAADAEAVRQIYRDAKHVGAVPECLTQIAEIGKRKAAAQRAAPPRDEHAAAEADLRAFAAEVGIDDIDRDAEGALGLPLSEAKADAIRGLLAQLRGNAA